MNQNLEEIFKEFSQKMKNHKLPRWNELTEIDLYMDQVIVLMEKYLSDLTSEEDNKLITPSMINNYVKLNMIPAPIRKKYSREHIAYLLIICSLKQVIPIAKIKEAIDFKLQSTTIENLLNDYSSLYQKTFNDVIETCNHFLDSNKDGKESFSDAALFLAITSSSCRHLSESILKMQTNGENL